LAVDHEPLAPPGRLESLQELRLPLDLLRWLPAWLGARANAAPQPRTVLLLPGFGAGPGSMRMMESYLRRRGHRVSDWGLGRNTGDARQLRSQLQAVIAEAIRAHGEPVALVGWSLGGYIAREYGRDHPHQIRRIVTLGSPVVGGPRYTATAGWYQKQGYDLEQVERTVAARYEVPLRVPVTAIYSRRDGIVAWRACIDRWSPRVQHLEVSETHVGLGFAPGVLALVGNALEQDEPAADPA
jgi:pimeloyl-ACP methyl ester carboxylesterase